MSDTMSFWDHLDQLRGCLLRMLAATAVFAIIAFCMKETLFDIVLAPHTSDFFIFRWMGSEPFSIQLINTELTEQFMTHLKVAAYTGLLFASPYVLYELFRFVSPGLYANERRVAMRVIGAAYVMFIIGTLLNYLIIFPVTVQFLGTYQVSQDIQSMLSLQSYIDTLVMMSLAMSLVFELPVVSGLLAKMGMLKATAMRRYRRHAIVLILVVSAIITPTTDAFTLLIVATPIALLYELSIVVAGWLAPRKHVEC